MLPQTSGVSPMPRTKRTRFIWTPGWSPSHPVSTTPAAFARLLRIGPDGAVDLGVHEHDVLAAPRSRRPPRGSRTRRRPVASTMASTDAAPHAARWSCRDRHRAGGDRGIHTRGVRHDAHVGDPGVPQGALPAFSRRAVDHDRDAHPRHAVDDLIDQAPAHEAGAHDARRRSGCPSASRWRSARSTRITESLPSRRPAARRSTPTAAATRHPSPRCPRRAAATSDPAPGRRGEVLAPPSGRSRPLTM